ncbi:Cilia- and flagella-associated protein 69 [Liparis tanakae]|uniref:Cilia-and flagella-associated protein 69 n=1 Tax=Liparis tanakae TaxID=230148 RepID=A0A4Z2FQ19_9TELE|nr:Cilia- and flagella-associated protein 69 [Liparis tanakae]
MTLCPVTYPNPHRDSSTCTCCTEVSHFLTLYELLKELTGISKILDVCAEKVKEHREYVPILCEALQICRLPFLKEKASDELNYAQDVIDFLSHMGTPPLIQLKLTICFTVEHPLTLMLSMWYESEDVRLKG